MGRGQGGTSAQASVPKRVKAIREIPPPAVGDSPRRILSIDGGGIRGIIPAVILAEIEARTGKHTSELFDFIAGTSTGALIALALTAPDDQGKPLWTAQDLVEMYKQEGPDIFKTNLFRKIKTARGVAGPKYEQSKLEEVLEKYVGNTELKDSLVDILIPTYDVTNRSVFFFRSERARANPDRNYKMKDVGLAATAAPTYFAPKDVVSPVTNQTFKLVDGGIFANNPAMCAWADLDRYESRPKSMVLSLGTGSQTDEIPYDGKRGWGLAGWAPVLLDAVFDGVSDTVDYQLWEKLGDDRYLRLQTDLDKADDRLDAASKKNIEKLEQEGREAIMEQSERLDKFLEDLQAL